jgi:hypothetical protein
MGPDDLADFEERTFRQWDRASLGDVRSTIDRRRRELARILSMTRTARFSLVAIVAAALGACGGDEPTAPRSPLGTFELAAVMGVPMPATVQDPIYQTWFRYSSGSLVLRADSTYDVEFFGHFRDNPNAPIGLGRSGTFHWTRTTGAVELLGSSGQPSYRGTASADTVVLGLYTLGGFPGPGGSIQDFTFVRTRN